MRWEFRPVVFTHVQHFLPAADRLAWFISLWCPQSIVALSPTLAQDIDALVADAETCTATYAELAPSAPAAIESSRFDIYEHPPLLRLVLIDDRFSELRWRKIRLASALERSYDASIVDVLLQQADTIPIDDRERSYALLTAFKQMQQPCKYGAEQISAWLDCFPSDQDHPTASTSPSEESDAGPARRVSVGGDPRRRDLFNELIQACEDNDLERMDALLPVYGRFNAITGDGQAWHSRLLRLAIDRRHLRIVELLLRCDPRGRVIRIEELLATLQPMSPSGNASDDALGHHSVSTAAVDILTGEEPLYAGLVWDAAALEQAVDTNDQLLLCFLLEHVDLPPVVLESARTRSINTGNTAFATRLSSAISAAEWTKGESATCEVSTESSSTRPLPQFTYREGERVSVQYAGGVHFWTGTIHRCWLNGTYDVRVTEHSESPVEVRVPASALRPLSARKLDDVRRSVIASLSQLTVDRVVTTAANGIREHNKIHHSHVVPDDRESDDEGDDDGDDDDSSDGSECGSDCDCGCESDSGSSRNFDSDSDSDAGSDSSDEDEPADVSAGLDVAVPPVLTVLAPNGLHTDPLYSMPETDDGEHTICLDAAAIEELTATGVIKDSGPQRAEHENNHEICTPAAAIAAGAITEAPKTPPPSANVESAVASEVPPDEINAESICDISTPTIANGMRPSITPGATPSSLPTIVSCAVTWTSSTVDLAQLSELQVGDRVDVRFRGREPWLRGRIAQCHRDKLAFDVAYDDGEHEEGVAREYTKLVTGVTKEETADEASVDLHLADSPPDVVGSEVRVSDARDTSDDDNDAASDAPVDASDPLLIKSPLDTATASTEANESHEMSLESAEAVSIDPAAVNSTGDTNFSGNLAASRELTANHELPTNGEPSTQQTALTVAVSTANGILKVESERGQLRYRAGQEIEANFLGIGKFHPARIVHVHANSEAYDVAFSEFDQTELRVLPVNIRPPRASTRRIKALLKGSSSSVVPIETVTANDPQVPDNSDETALDSSHIGDPSPPQATSNKLDEVRRPSNSPLVAPLSTPLTERPQTSRTCRTSSSSNSRSSLSRHEDGSVRGRPRPSNRATISSREVEKWRNVDIILNRKRRLLNAPTGNVENTKVPWSEEFASIQSLKRFATQHPDVLRDHMCVHMLPYS